ncbi:MAG: Uma2 family endonuclease [Cytophagales bacterium]|jgi:Uma2 family endonuclease|nr:Uma2 family endonuclease [Cytophagales bacterium]
MANAVAQKKHYTTEAYFAYEEHSEFRHEFHHGELFRMDATTIRHNEIIDNVKDVLRTVFRPKGCRVVSESIRLEAVRNEYYPYPDIMVTCHGFDRESDSTVRNPSLIVEVLSKPMAANDRGLKWKHYQTIPALQHYLLVSQYECSAELYSRTEKPEVWLYQSYNHMTDVIEFQRLDFSLPVAKIYENITFPTPEELAAENPAPEPQK